MSNNDYEDSNDYKPDNGSDYQANDNAGYGGLTSNKDTIINSPTTKGSMKINNVKDQF